MWPRDRRNIESLRELGWRVGVIWECETGNEDAVRVRLAGLVEPEPPVSDRTSLDSRSPEVTE